MNNQQKTNNIVSPAKAIYVLGKVSVKTLGNGGRRQEGLKDKGYWDDRSL